MKAVWVGWMEKVKEWDDDRRMEMMEGWKDWMSGRIGWMEKSEGWRRRAKDGEDGWRTVTEGWRRRRMDGEEGRMGGEK